MVQCTASGKSVISTRGPTLLVGTTRHLGSLGNRCWDWRNASRRGEIQLGGSRPSPAAVAELLNLGAYGLVRGAEDSATFLTRLHHHHAIERHGEALSPSMRTLSMEIDALSSWTGQPPYGLAKNVVGHMVRRIFSQKMGGARKMATALATKI